MSGGVTVGAATDYYAVLGVPSTSTVGEIRTAFRALARQHHPDVNPDPQASERFRAVVAAYEVLSDPLRRTEYDARRSRGSQGGPRSTGTAGQASGRSSAGAGPSWSGGEARKPHARSAPSVTMPPVRGLDRHSTLRVEAEILAEGGTGVLQHRRWEICARCGGFGRLQEEVTCAACGGAGFRNGHISDPCKVCWTTGTTTVCPDCTGKGSLWQAKRIEVTIPTSARYGQQLRLRGMGDAGPRGGPPGDLYVELATPLPAAVQAVASSDLVQAALRRLEEWLDRFAPYPA